MSAESIVMGLTSSLWLYPAMLGLAGLDAFTIVLPSETVVAALASTAVSLGQPNIAVLGVSAALGAHFGDLGVFGVGRLLSKTPLLAKKNKVTSALNWTKRRLDRQGPLFIMTGRYIPYGRILVNLTAGSSGFSLRRFAALSALGCVMWAGVYVALGAGMGAWFGAHWWIAIVLAVVVALVVGYVVDRLVRRTQR